MAYDTLVKEAEELSEDKLRKVIEYILLLKTEDSENGTGGHKRKLGVYKDEFFYMSEDFDEVPDCFKEYI